MVKLNKDCLKISETLNEELELPDLVFVYFDFDEGRYLPAEVNGSYPVVLYFRDGLAENEYDISTLSEFALYCLKNQDAMDACKRYFEYHYDIDNLEITRNWYQASMLASRYTMDKEAIY